MPKVTAPTAPEGIMRDDTVLIPDREGDDLQADDIPDPAIPLPFIVDALQAQLNGAVDPNTLHGQALLEVNQALFAFSQHAATVLASIDKSWEAALRVLNHNNAATLALKEALQSYTPAVPYSATISTLSPSGYPMAFTVQERNQEAFLAAVGGMLEFLKLHGFTPLTATGL